ncbi:hypothetical protein D3C73_1532820 [compost metagenome]
MTQVIARELPVLVGRVLDPVQLMLRRIRLKLGPGSIEQRPQQIPFAQRALAWHP